MADTTSMTTGTVLVVIAGQWTKGTLVPIRVIIGGTVYIILLSFMDNAVPDLAKKFAILVLISALFIYAVPIFEGLGLLGPEKQKQSKKRQQANQRRQGKGN